MQAGESEQAWAPYIEMFNGFVASGKPPGIARRLIKIAMTKDVLPSTGELPGKDAILKKLATPKK